MVKEEIRKEIKDFIEFNENEGTTYSNLWDTMGSDKKKTHSSECLQKKLERAYTSSLTKHMKALGQKEANIPKRSRRQEIIKLRAEINQAETKRTIKESTKPVAGSLRKSTT